MTTTVTALPTAEQVSALAEFGTGQVHQTAAKLKQRLPELAEEPRTAEAELILSVPETLGKAINHYARLLLDALDGPLDLAEHAEHLRRLAPPPRASRRSTRRTGHRGTAVAPSG